jgi:hypothetical protein
MLPLVTPQRDGAITSGMGELDNYLILLGKYPTAALWGLMQLPAQGGVWWVV